MGGIPDVVTADVNEVQAKEEAKEEDEKRKSIKKVLIRLESKSSMQRKLTQLLLLR